MHVSDAATLESLRESLEARLERESLYLVERVNDSTGDYTALFTFSLEHALEALKDDANDYAEHAWHGAVIEAEAMHDRAQRIIGGATEAVERLSRYRSTLATIATIEDDAQRRRNVEALERTVTDDARAAWQSQPYGVRASTLEDARSALARIGRDGHTLEDARSTLESLSERASDDRRDALEALEHAEDCARAVDDVDCAWLEDVGYGHPRANDSLSVWVSAEAEARRVQRESDAALKAESLSEPIGWSVGYLGGSVTTAGSAEVMALGEPVPTAEGFVTLEAWLEYLLEDGSSLVTT